jgi:hypothetical protein
MFANMLDRFDKSFLNWDELSKHPSEGYIGAGYINHYRL